ncbi:MAG: hypothetical protein WAU54_19665, partial [Chania sp.]
IAGSLTLITQNYFFLFDFCYNQPLGALQFVPIPRGMPRLCRKQKREHRLMPRLIILPGNCTEHC